MIRKFGQFKEVLKNTHVFKYAFIFFRFLKKVTGYLSSDCFFVFPDKF